ncbi:MAG: TetR/AcrR family transcriptional regulator [Bacteroidota bacterium]
MKKYNKEKEVVRQEILHAAMDLYTEHGIEKTSIRNIAKQIGYSPGAVYSYFKDKAEIMFSLHINGFMELKRRFQVLRSVSDPIARLKAMGRQYIQFSLDYPALYDPMFVSAYPMDHLENASDENWKQGEATFEELRQVVADCIANGHFAGHQAEPLSFVIWSMVHGMVTLRNSNRTEKAQLQDFEDIVMQGYQEFEAMVDKL